MDVDVAAVVDRREPGSVEREAVEHRRHDHAPVARRLDRADVEAAGRRARGRVAERGSAHDGHGSREGSGDDRVVHVAKTLNVGHRELDIRHAEIKGGVRSFTAPMVQHVVDCMDGKDTPVGTGEDGLAALKILNALKESALQEGKRVKL